MNPEKSLLQKAEEALLEARIESKHFRKEADAFVRDLQQELWSRDYGHSWGIHDEFLEIVYRHPHLTQLSIKSAADELLQNLSTWSPVLEKKESKARAASQRSPENIEAGKALERAISAIINRRVLREGVAPVFICQFDHSIAPEIPGGLWALWQGRMIHSVFRTEEEATAAAGRIPPEQKIEIKIV